MGRNAQTEEQILTLQFYRLRSGQHSDNNRLPRTMALTRIRAAIVRRCHLEAEPSSSSLSYKLQQPPRREREATVLSFRYVRGHPRKTEGGGRETGAS